MSEILTIGEAVASHLGEQWTARSDYDHAATLSNGVVEVFIRWDGYGENAKRIEATPSYHHVTGDNRVYDLLRYDERDATNVKATFAKDRDAKAIARQIEKVIVPVATEWTATLRERVAARDDAKAKRTASFEAIKAIVPGAHRQTDESSDVSLYTPAAWYGNVDLYHDGQTASVTLRGLPIETVLEILATLPKVAK